MGFFWRKKTIRIIKCTGQLIYVTLYIDFSLETIVKNQAACVTSHFDFTLEKCGQKPDCIEVACCYCCCRIYFTWLVVAGVDWWCRIWSFDRNLRLSTSAADLWSLGSFYRVQVSDCGSSADTSNVCAAYDKLPTEDKVSHDRHYINNGVVCWVVCVLLVAVIVLQFFTTDPPSLGWRGGLVVGRRTCDLWVAGSRPGRDAAA